MRRLSYRFNNSSSNSIQYISPQPLHLHIININKAYKRIKRPDDRRQRKIFRKMTGRDEEKRIVCVLDASTYVGFWVLKKLLSKGYIVHAALQTHGEKDIRKKIVNLEETEKSLKTFTVDTLDYHSIFNAVKGCCALFCCLDNAQGYYDDTCVDVEIMSVINVVEACAQTDTINKVIFNSSLTAAVWRENTTCTINNVDERSWSDPDFCRKNKLWYALTKTLSEKAAWALANDRMLNMVSINVALALGPSVAQLNSHVTMAYLQGATQMYEGGVLAFADVKFLADVHIQAFEDPSTAGRYLCFKETVNTEEEAYKFAQSFTPLMSLPLRYKCENGDASYIGRLQRNKLNKLVEGAAFI